MRLKTSQYYDNSQALDVSEFSREYGEKLTEITAQCDSLIGLNRDLDSAKTEARIAQGALYDAAQLVSALLLTNLTSYYVVLHQLSRTLQYVLHLL